MHVFTSAWSPQSLKNINIDFWLFKYLLSYISQAIINAIRVPPTVLLQIISFPFLIQFIHGKLISAVINGSFKL